MEVFKANLEDAEANKTLQENSYEDAIILRDKYMDEMKTHLNKMATIDTRIAEINIRVENFKSRALHLSDLRQAALQKKNASIDDLDGIRERKKVLESDRIGRAETVANYVEKASIVGPRISIEAGDTTATIEKKLEKLIADNQRCEARFV